MPDTVHTCPLMPAARSLRLARWVDALRKQQGDLDSSPQPLRVGRYMEITNRTRRPITVPLPGGKRLHLGPGKTGQLGATPVDHPPLEALIKSGEVVVVDPALTPPNVHRNGGR